MLTTKEVEQYIRLTLKQYKLDVKVEFSDSLFLEYGFFGGFYTSANRIELDVCVLKSFALFKHTLLHELCHKLDEKERGSIFTKTGRKNFHGANFNKWCKVLGIPKGRFTPEHLY